MPQRKLKTGSRFSIIESAMIVFLLTFICVMGYMMTALSRTELGPEKETAKTWHKKVGEGSSAEAHASYACSTIVV